MDRTELTAKLNQMPGLDQSIKHRIENMHDTSLKLLELENHEIDKPNACMLVEDYIQTYLCVHLNIDDPKIDRAVYNQAKWLEFAGGPYSPVDLVDHQGNVKLTVPPLFPKDLFIKAQLKDKDPSDTLINRVQYVEHEAPTVTVKQKGIEKALDLYFDTEDEDIKENHQKLWYDFFAKLGITQEVFNQSSGVGNPQPTQDEPVNFLFTEDWQ